MNDKGQFFKRKSVLVLCALISTALWGSAFPCVKAGYQLWHIELNDAATQMIFAGGRFILAGLMTLLTAHFMEKRCIQKEHRWRSLKKIILLGVVQTALQYVFYYISMAHVTGIKGAILNGASAFVCVLMARIYYKEQEQLSRSRILVSKEISGEIKPVTLCGGQLLSGGILLSAAGSVMGGHIDWNSIGIKSLLLLFYMAFISAAAFSLWTVLLKYNSMGKVTVFNFMIPVFGTILSAVFLGDDLLNPYILSSLPLVCAGIWLVNKTSGFSLSFRQKKRMKRE